MMPKFCDFLVSILKTYSDKTLAKLNKQGVAAVFLSKGLENSQNEKVFLRLKTAEIQFGSNRMILDIKTLFKLNPFLGGKHPISVTSSLCDRNNFVTSYLLN